MTKVQKFQASPVRTAKIITESIWMGSLLLPIDYHILLAAVSESTFRWLCSTD